MKFALIDETKGATTGNGAALDTSTLSSIASACTLWLNRDVAAEWGGSHWVRVSDGSDLQPGEYPFAILPALPGAPGAIAYHDVDGNGLPVLFDGISLSDTLSGPGNSLSVAIAHELAETVQDEGCNLVAVGLDGRGYAHELCDPVEVQSYEVLLGDGTHSGIWVSNLVLPPYFVPNRTGAFDLMTSRGIPGAVAPPAPLVIAPGNGGNYQIVFTQIGGQTQVTALGKPSRREKRAHWSSRSHRRGLRLAA